MSLKLTISCAKFLSANSSKKNVMSQSFDIKGICLSFANNINIMSSSENRGKVWFFKHKYDWAWIKGAIDGNLILGCSKTNQIQ